MKYLANSSSATYYDCVHYITAMPQVYLMLVFSLGGIHSRIPVQFKLFHIPDYL